MIELMNGIRSMLEACRTVRPRESVLIVADNEGQSSWLGYLFMNVANSMQAEAYLTIINPPEMRAAEPPAAVAAAMKSVNVVIRISNKAAFVHTAARREATASV